MKERLITRTISNSEVTVKVYNLDTDEISTTTLAITGKYSNDELLKRVENRLAGGNFKVLKLVDVKFTEKLYACTEAQFMAIAKEIPAREANKIEEG